MSDTLRVITNIDEIENKQWDEINNSRFANFFHTPEAFHFFQTCNLNPFFVAILKHDKVLGILTGIIQKETGFLKSFLSKRAIIFSGPVFNEKIRESEISLILNALTKHLKNEVIYIELRNFNDYSKYKPIFSSAGFKYLDHLNFHVNCVDEKQILKNLSKSKLRQIKKSFKTGAEIVEASSVQEVQQFYTILKELYTSKVKTPLFSESFFVHFFEQNLGKYLLVKYKENIIGGIMCPVFNKRIIYEWYVCGEDGKHEGVYPSILATWAAIDYANKNNIPRFDFMGAGKPNEDYGVREFKSKFGGALVENGRFLYVSKPFLFRLGKVAVKIMKSIK